MDGMDSFFYLNPLREDYTTLGFPGWEESDEAKEVLAVLREQGISNADAYFDPADANYGFMHPKAVTAPSKLTREPCHFCKVHHVWTSFRRTTVSIARQKKCSYWILAVAASEALDGLSIEDIGTFEIEVPYGVESPQPFSINTQCGSQKGTLTVQLPTKPIREDFVGAGDSIEGRLQLARAWVQDCDVNHSGGCTSWKNSQLPDRILDLEAVGLVPDHLVCIAFNSLPKSFQHAVTVTRALGVLYLWIDSLCIVQDDVEDWRTQSRRMGSIYANSYLTITASSAADSNAGFCTTRSWIRAISIKQDGSKIMAYAYRSDITIHSPGTLDNRGWFYQEWLLSGRILWFDEHEMSWSCVQDDFCECAVIGLDIGYDVHYVDRTRARKMYRKMHSETWSIDPHNAWYDLVGTYTDRQLTFQTDRLPAFTAIAEWFQQLTGDVYLAGFWKSHLLEGMSWHNSHDHIYGSCCECDGDLCRGCCTSSEPVAPSWSWASSGGYKRSFPGLVPDMAKSGREPLDTEVVNVDYRPLSDNEFGPGRGKITLRGRIGLALLTPSPGSPYFSKSYLTSVSSSSPTTISSDLFLQQKLFLDSCALKCRQ